MHPPQGYYNLLAGKKQERASLKTGGFFMSKNRSEAQKKADKEYERKRAGQRTRNWTCVVYPESAPENWRGIIDGTHIEWIESPLHDRDVNPDGEMKKPHWHILLMFESVKTYEQVKELTDELHAPAPQKCGGVKGLVRYMAHMDNPEKVQYNPADIVGHGGVDVSDILRMTATERYTLIAEMMTFVREHGIVEIDDLLEYAQRERFNDWFPLLCDSCMFVMSVMVKSRRHRGTAPSLISSEVDKLAVDESTGEVIE